MLLKSLLWFRHSCCLCMFPLSKYIIVFPCIISFSPLVSIIIKYSFYSFTGSELILHYAFNYSRISISSTLFVYNIYSPINFFGIISAYNIIGHQMMDTSDKGLGRKDFGLSMKLFPHVLQEPG